MKDYLAVIGLACLNEDFRADLLADGVAAVDAHFPDADLTSLDRERLDDFKHATAAKRTQAQSGFAALRDSLEAVCKNPPCPYTP